MASEKYPTDPDYLVKSENNENNSYELEIDIEALAREIFKLLKTNLRIENERIARK